MFNINIVATWSSVDNDCRSQGKDWTLAKQTKTHYTLYNLFLPQGMPSLSSLASYYQSLPKAEAM